MPDLRIQPGPHVFVDDVDAPVLDDGDRHHLSKSLRLRAGDALTVSDGAGAWRAARFGEVVEPDGPIHRVDPPPYAIGIGVALTKAAKPEFAVQKATEIGLDRIVLFASEHSVVRWDESKRHRNLVRLRRVAREAAMQSRRVAIPTVEFVDELGALAATATGGDVTAVARADFGGEPVGPSHRLVLIGPEGGWSEREREWLPAAVDLGPTVLRAETAAVVASSRLAVFRGEVTRRIHP